VKKVTRVEGGRIVALEGADPKDVALVEAWYRDSVIHEHPPEDAWQLLPGGPDDVNLYTGARWTSGGGWRDGLTIIWAFRQAAHRYVGIEQDRVGFRVVYDRPTPPAPRLPGMPPSCPRF